MTNRYAIHENAVFVSRLAVCDPARLCTGCADGPISPPARAAGWCVADVLLGCAAGWIANITEMLPGSNKQNRVGGGASVEEVCSRGRAFDDAAPSLAGGPQFSFAVTAGEPVCFGIDLFWHPRTRPHAFFTREGCGPPARPVAGSYSRVSFPSRSRVLS
jgi:hypothetical protein